MTSVADPLRAVASFGLLGSRNAFPDAPLADRDFDALLPRLVSNRVIGLSASAASVGEFRVTDEQASRLHAAHADAMCACLHLEATLLDLAATFQARDIDIRVIKGPAAAHLDYADPTLRSFGDIDLLVRSDDFDEAARLLLGLGYGRAAPEPRPGFDRRFGKGAEFVLTADGTNVDLHRTFVLGPLGLQVRLDELWDGAETFMLGGQKLAALAPTQRLLAACYNAVVSDASPRLSTLRDVAQIVLSGDVEASDAVEMAAGWRAEHVLTLGVRAAWHELDISDVVGLSAWAVNHDVDIAAAQVLRVYRSSQAGYAGLAWTTARQLPMLERFSFLRALAFPAGGRLGSEGFGLGQRVRRAARGYLRT
jgi:hypothetical protein